ncbi:hypothetical protein V8F06_010409 [Rhypophila decipiens]
MNLLPDQVTVDFMHYVAWTILFRTWLDNGVILDRPGELDKLDYLMILETKRALGFALDEQELALLEIDSATPVILCPVYRAFHLQKRESEMRREALHDQPLEPKPEIPKPEPKPAATKPQPVVPMGPAPIPSERWVDIAEEEEDKEDKKAKTEAGSRRGGLTDSRWADDKPEGNVPNPLPIDWHYWALNNRRPAAQPPTSQNANVPEKAKVPEEDEDEDDSGWVTIGGQKYPKPARVSDPKPSVKAPVVEAGERQALTTVPGQFARPKPTPTADAKDVPKAAPKSPRPAARPSTYIMDLEERKRIWAQLRQPPPIQVKGDWCKNEIWRRFTQTGIIPSDIHIVHADCENGAKRLYVTFKNDEVPRSWANIDQLVAVFQGVNYWVRQCKPDCLMVDIEMIDIDKAVQKHYQQLVLARVAGAAPTANEKTRVEKDMTAKEQADVERK